MTLSNHVLDSSGLQEEIALVGGAVLVWRVAFRMDIHPAGDDVVSAETSSGADASLGSV